MNEAGPSAAPAIAQYMDDISEDPEQICDNGESDLNRIELFWAEQNLLSLDGGGIRGYWTLLVLNRLMWTIAAEERKHVHDRADHSFFPAPLPHHLATKPSQQEVNFLPCHYFDYICGSSTGALIAIMLGRLRMTVSDCLYEYEAMSNEIFGKPRLVSQRNIGIVPWDKYSHPSLISAFKQVTARRCEADDHQLGPVRFPSQKGVCNTFVTSYRKVRQDSSPVGVAELYKIRSYDYVQKGPPPEVKNKRKPTDASVRDAPFSVGVQEREERNMAYKADALEIWEVARAATAAPMYFKPQKFTRSMGGTTTKMYFTDGGFGVDNNPTGIGIDEIKSLHGNRGLGTVVSLGTARGLHEGNGTSIFKRAGEFLDRATDPQYIHDRIKNEAKGKNGRKYLYFRFNDRGGLRVEMDEWKPNGLFARSRAGSKTLRTITDSFMKWVARPEFMDCEQKQLEECARALVQRRRARARDKNRWDRYALGVEFNCCYNNCRNDPWLDEGQFKEHLRLKHKLSGENSAEIVKRMREEWKYQPRVW